LKILPFSGIFHFSIFGASVELVVTISGLLIFPNLATLYFVTRQSNENKVRVT